MIKQKVLEAVFIYFSFFETPHYQLVCLCRAPYAKSSPGGCNGYSRGRGRDRDLVEKGAAHGVGSVIAKLMNSASQYMLVRRSNHHQAQCQTALHIVSEDPAFAREEPQGLPR